MAETSNIEKLIERLPGEPPMAYAAFLKFASLPIADRAGRSQRDPGIAKEIGYSVDSMRAWMTNYDWHERASLIDAHDFLVQHQERKEASRADNEKFLEANRKAKEKAIELADQMLDVAGTLLKDASLANKVIEGEHVRTADGKMVPTVTHIHMKSKVSDIPRLVEVAVRTSRLAAELPTEIVEHEEMFNADLSKLSDEELDVYRMQNHKRLVQLGANVKTGDLGEIG